MKSKILPLQITILIVFFLLINTVFTSTILLSKENQLETNQKIIMLDPSGHAKHLGRKLKEGYERGATLKFAEKLKDALSNMYDFRIVLSRNAGETLVPLQTASFANRLNVDFLLNIHIYQTTNAKPIISIYQLCYNTLTDFAKRTFDPMEFIPLEQTHLKNIKKSRSIGHKIKSVLTQKAHAKILDFTGPHALPIKTLIGITKPAITLEIGINKESKLDRLISPIAKSLFFLKK